MEEKQIGTIKAVIFDLDGVIVSTDECHYKAWQRMADEEGIYFDRSINDRLRGVSRMQCVDIILEKASKGYNAQEIAEMADRKNKYYRELIQSLTPEDILPGVTDLIGKLKNSGIKVAIGSSSRNTALILERTGLNGSFEVVVDGNCILRSKPDPEVFQKAAELLNVSARECLVIEDADAGVQAALSAGMKVLGVGAASANISATLRLNDLSNASVDWILSA